MNGQPHVNSTNGWGSTGTSTASLTGAFEVGSTVTTAHAWLNHPDDLVAHYNLADVLATVRGHKGLLRALHRNQQLDFYDREVWSLVPAVMAMEARGLPYDTTKKGLYRKQLRRELAMWDDRLRELYLETVRESPRWADIERARDLKKWFFGDKPEGTKPCTKTEWKKLAKYLPEAIHDTTQGEPLISFNLASDHHLRDWLFKVLGLKPSTHTETKLPSVDQDALNRILQRLRGRRKKPPGFEELGPEDQWALLPTDEKILCGLMHRARLEKIDNDYLDPEVRSTGRSCDEATTGGNAQDAGRAQESVGSSRVANRGGVQSFRGDRGTRVFPRIKLTGTESGRFSYADPPVHSWPDEIRHLVCAPPGNTIVSADSRAIEARVFAHLIKDDDLIELFERNAADPENPEWDVHIRNACDLFAWNLDEFLATTPKKQKASRNTAKTFLYGVVQYGGTPETAKTKVSCPCPWCAHKSPPSIKLTTKEKSLQAQRWFHKHPRALLWRREVSRELATTKALVDIMGRKRYFAAPFQFGGHIEREGWNWKIQAPARNIILRALRALHAKGVPLILDHHDGLYAEVPDEREEFTLAQMRATMEAPVPEFGGAVFPIEGHTGQSWADAS